MKDLVIKEATLKRELYLLLTTFVIAVLINLYAIVTRNGSFVELFTQLGWTLLIGLILYIMLAMIRSIYFGAVYLFRKAKTG